MKNHLGNVLEEIGGNLVPKHTVCAILDSLQKVLDCEVRRVHLHYVHSQSKST